MASVAAVSLAGVALRIATAVAAVTLVSGCSDQSINSDEQAKAQELQELLDPIGVTVPAGVAASLYSDDGGVACAAASGQEHLARRGHLVGMTGALRKTEVDSDLVAASRAVIEVYCPDNLDTFDDYVSGLSVGD